MNDLPVETTAGGNEARPPEIYISAHQFQLVVAVLLLLIVVSILGGLQA